MKNETTKGTPGSTSFPFSFHKDPSYALSNFAASTDLSIPATRDVVDSLPEDLFIMILQLLDEKDQYSCSLVNKRWYQVERMSRVKITITDSTLTSASLDMISSRYPLIESLHVDGTLFPCASICSDGTGGLLVAGKKWSKIKDIELFCCMELDDRDFTDLISSCGTNLQKLIIRHCDKLTNISAQAIALHCPKLENLMLQAQKIINYDAIKDVIRECSQYLKYLVLWMRMGDDIVQAVGHSSLERLTLNGHEFTNGGLPSIGTGCTQLKELLVYNNPNITDRGLDYIIIGCPYLMNIELSNLNSLQCPRINSKQLCRLVLQGLRLQSDSLVETGKKCKLLQVLVLCDCQGVGDESIRSITKGCCYLRHLNISEGNKLSDLAFTDVGKNCKFLMYLRLVWCERINNVALLSHSLRKLILRGCNMLGDERLVAIARGCPGITYLDASYLELLSDIGLKEVSEVCCPLLRILAIINCPAITSTGVAHVILNWKNVEKVEVEAWKVDESIKCTDVLFIQEHDYTDDEGDDEWDGDFWCY